MEGVVDNLHDAEQRQAAQADAYLRRAEAAEAVVRMRDTKISSLFDLLIKAKTDLARKEGYVERVRELDGGPTTTPVHNPDAGDFRSIEDVRSAMIEADDGTFGRMVSSMDLDTLNKVMGKTDGEQSDILR